MIKGGLTDRGSDWVITGERYYNGDTFYDLENRQTHEIRCDVGLAELRYIMFGG